MNNSSISNPLAKTALYISGCRSLEHINHPSDYLYIDKFAKDLCGDYGFSFLEAVSQIIPLDISKEQKIKILADSVSVRTKYLDNIIMKHIKNDNNFTQLVIFGVGADCRSYRLDFNQKLTIFELDLNEIIEYRKEKLKIYETEIKANIIPISCDFKDQNWKKLLIEKGFDKNKKTIFLIEGLLMYLNYDEIRNFLGIIKEYSCKNSIITGDVLSEAHLNSPMTIKLREIWDKWGSPIVSGITYPEELFKEFNFNCVVDEYGSERADFGRVSSESKEFSKKFPRGCKEEKEIPRNLFFEGIKNDDF